MSKPVFTLTPEQLEKVRAEFDKIDAINSTIVMLSFEQAERRKKVWATLGELAGLTPNKVHEIEPKTGEIFEV